MPLTDQELEAVDQYISDWWQAIRTKDPVPAAPIALLQRAAVAHPNGKVKKFALTILDHEANDESAETFRLALADPLPSVRRHALHGLSCQRCRVGELCADDVVPTLIDVLEQDENPSVRQAALWPLLLLTADERVVPAFARAAENDPDELVRYAAAAARDGNYREVKSRKSLRRREAKVGVRGLVE